MEQWQGEFKLEVMLRVTISIITTTTGITSQKHILPWKGMRVKPGPSGGLILPDQNMGSGDPTDIQILIHSEDSLLHNLFSIPIKRLFETKKNIFWRIPVMKREP
jgi:hypothetical protein